MDYLRKCFIPPWLKKKERKKKKKRAGEKKAALSLGRAVWHFYFTDILVGLAFYTTCKLLHSPPRPLLFCSLPLLFFPSLCSVPLCFLSSYPRQPQHLTPQQCKHTHTSRYLLVWLCAHQFFAPLPYIFPPSRGWPIGLTWTLSNPTHHGCFLYCCCCWVMLFTYLFLSECRFGFWIALYMHSHAHGR